MHGKPCQQPQTIKSLFVVNGACVREKDFTPFVNHNVLTNKHSDAF